MHELWWMLIAGDWGLFFFINTTLANPVTDLIMPFITRDLNLKIFYGLCLIGILWRGDKRLRLAVIFSLITIAVSDQLSSALLKPVIGRLRPCQIMEVHLLVGCGAGRSMPSSHAANLFGQAFFFWLAARPSFKYLLPLAIVVSLSRVFVGVHYPGDILVGGLVGAFSGGIIGLLFIRIFPEKDKPNNGENRRMPLKIEVTLGDITRADTEGIVNAANNHLWMGSGVAGAIKTRGGEEIERDAVSKGPIEVGGAMESIPGRLPFKYIIHAAGMGQDLKTSEDIVGQATRNSILLADKLGLKSLAFPAIGTGVGGFPLDKAAVTMIAAAREMSDRVKILERIVFVLFDNEAYMAFKKAL